ncbi:MAG: ribose-5-phosphate isomerase RpiA [Methylophilaceae bacterium]|nr:ribose-5-phosphate isomerase RpiA [Methylophilaceae bacterium]
MNDKQCVAIHAARKVEDGMLIGLGTGSTANFFIQELARRYQEEKLRVRAVASSVASAIKAQALGLPLVSLEHVDRIDLYVDGCDEIAPDMTLLKGRGYDLVMEKLLARAADRFLVIAEQAKRVSRIGEKFAIPIEVMPFAWQVVKRRLELLGGQGELRQTPYQDGLVRTSYGSLVLDMTFDPALDAASLDEALNAIPGVVEHGIFRGLATDALIVANGEIEEWSRPFQAVHAPGAIPKGDDSASI